jgi:hypothetical protein
MDEPSHGRGEDPQAVDALSGALRTQCAQLVGHTMVLLRNIAESVTKALARRGCVVSKGDALFECFACPKSDNILPPTMQDLVRKYSGANFNNTAAGTPPRTLALADQSLLSALLFVGRIAWLFKIRGGFLHLALEDKASQLKDRSDPSSSNTEDQFRSAFEIADANGSGLLSYAEAVEVRVYATFTAIITSITTITSITVVNTSSRALDLASHPLTSFSILHSAIFFTL